jgi:ubiquinone/menaquinone biosynthesis C-methylase UbiE
MTGEEQRALDQYIDRVYAPGLASYKEVLKSYRLEEMKIILDIGCGPGEWAIAAAELSPFGKVVGLDTNQYLLNFASALARKKALVNCAFVRESYEKATRLFEPECIDLLLCNSVIQYIDEQTAFQVFSRLLKRGGTVLMFWNHGPLYYLWKAAKEIFRFRWSSALQPLDVLCVAALRRALGGSLPPDHFVTFKTLRNSAAKEGFRLEKIKTRIALDYGISLLGISSVYSCRGVKT